jgi:methylmalonyl-CoA mutase C-terminal domain/subunit
VPKVTALLREKGAEDILVLVGGIIPDQDVPALRQAGVAGVFGPGTSTVDIVRFINERVLGVPAGA